RDCRSLLGVVGGACHRLIAIVDLIVLVIDVVAVVVINGLRPSVIDPAHHAWPGGHAPVIEIGVVRVVPVMVIPPVVVEPVIVVVPIAAPVIVNVGEIVLPPVVPLIPVGNAIGTMMGPIAG